MFYLTQNQLAELEGILDSNSATPFADMYDQIFSWVQGPDVLGNLADGNVKAWFGAAAQTNRGLGGASDFIRTYTAAQPEILTCSPEKSSV